MKKIINLILIFCFLFNPIANSKENITSNYLRSTYRIPQKYLIMHNEIKGEFLVSPGILLEAGGPKWQHCAMWWEINKSAKGENRKCEILFKAGYGEFKMFNTVAIEIEDRAIVFSEKDNNLKIHRETEKYLNNVLKDFYIINAEYLHCLMDFKTMKRILVAEEFKITVQGDSEKIVFNVVKEKEWEKLLEL